MELHDDRPVPGGVARFYDTLGPLLSRAWDDNFHFGYWDTPDDPRSVESATDRFTDVLIGRLGVDVGHRVLDVGCGIGKPALRVARATGAGVLGISVNEGQVDDANRRARAEGLDRLVSFECADAMRMPYDDASFDAVLALESILHMDRGVALREMARVLRRGGRLVLTDVLVPEGAGDADLLRRSEEVLNGGGATLDDYLRLTREAGLDVVELVDVSQHTSPTVPRMAERFRRSGLVADPATDAGRIVAVTEELPEVGCLILVARHAAQTR
ncbi:methyltransferase domain-containing protein [Nocardiopsis mangrovi]|uniref:Methyltransferase domain-containing protein n=1 Tax=Nocardiopsis mangrovi TaxID=1179818 RepID=A0ABV9DX52_9ACTN